MTKIIYYADMHFGDDKVGDRVASHDVQVYGLLASHMSKALFSYAHNNNINTIIHGGDESTFSSDLDEHRKRAQIIATVIKKSNLDIHRVIGNHEPIFFLDELGISSESYSAPLPDDKTHLLICQPDITKQKKQTIYTYNQEDILNTLNNKSPDTNLILSGHWAFDREIRGCPEINFPSNAYIRNTDKLSDNFSAIANGNPNRVVGLFGHEHRFSMTTDLGFHCIVMPAITQEDINNALMPCGLFVEIDDEGDALSIQFKQILLNIKSPKKSIIRDVSLDYMNRYYRPFGLING